MRDDQNVVRLAHVCDLLGGGDAVNAIDIELGDIEGLEVEGVAEAVDRVFVFAAREVDDVERLELGVSMTGKSAIVPSGRERCRIELRARNGSALRA